MTTNLHLQIHQYADDTTLLEVVDNPVISIQNINTDLHTLSLWADQWRVTFNALKTHFMRISKKKKKPVLDDIVLNGCQITEVDKYPYLGLIINNKLNWSDHAEHLITRVSKKLTMLNRVRHVLPRLALENLYTSMIRPILDYADMLYNNCTLSIDRTIEGVQRRAALICTGAYKLTEHVKLLKDLGWTTLKARRNHHILSLFYKLIKGKSPTYVTNLIPQPHITNYNLRTQNNLRIPRMRLTCSKTFFISYAIKLWNNLPLSTRQAPSLNVFKKLTIPKSIPSNYNKLCSGYYGRLLTRLRLELSGLNAHRFKYNIHITPICSLCHLAPEDNYHYFFSCPTHFLPRQHFMNLLESELDLDITNQKKLLNIILYGNINHNQYTSLLKFIYQYIQFTGRFEFTN